MRSIYFLSILALVAICMAFTFAPRSSTMPSNSLACNLSVDAGQDQNLCSSPQNVNLDAFITGDYIGVQWEPANLVNNPNSPNTSATINQTTTFEVTVIGTDPTTNLVSNGDFSNGFAGFTSDYIEGTGGTFGLLSGEGQYAIATNASDTHTNFASCTDHTGGGDMLVVNGAGIQNQEVWCQTVAVTPNTDYAFSAWVTSVVSGSPAQLQFSVNGVTVGNIFNASASTCQWNQFYEVWSSGSNTSIELCIVNQNTATGGNDFALDDIAFSPLCESIDQVTYTITDLNAFWLPPIYLCAASDPIDLNTLLLPGATPGGTWTVNGVTTSFFVPSDFGVGAYSVTYEVSQPPCQESHTDFIVVSPLPEAGWQSPINVCINTTPFSLNSLLNPTTSTFGQWTINGFPASEFDPASLGLGPHLVTYSLGVAPCISEESQFIEVTNGGDPSWTPPSTVCTNSPAIFFNDLLSNTATPGGTWYIDGVPADELDPAIYGAGSYSITYVVGELPCTSEDTQRIDIEDATTGTWTAPSGLCTSSAAFLLSDLLDPGSSDSGIWTINGNTAVAFDPLTLGSGTFTVTYTVGNAPCSSSITQDIEVLPSVIPNWNNPGPLCTSNNALLLDDLLDGNATPGGTWTINGNLSTNLDPNALGAGNYMATYTIGTGPCAESQTQTIEINASPIAMWDAPNELCIDDAPLILIDLLDGNATLGGTFTLDGQVITSFDPATSNAGTYTIIYSVGSSPCSASFNQVIEVLDTPNPAWTPSGVLCTTSASFSLDNLLDTDATTGGSWTVNGNAATQFDPVSLGAGTFEVIYTVGPGNCQASETNNLTIIDNPNADWAPPAPLCANDPSFLLNDLLDPSATQGGTWTIDGQAATSFDPTSLSSGPHAVIYSVGTDPCIVSNTQNIEILPAVDVTWNTPGTLCTTSPSIDLNSLLNTTSTSGGSWTINGNAATQLNPSALGSGNFLVVYTAGPSACQESNSNTITISDTPNVNWTLSGPLCPDDPSLILDDLLEPGASTGGTWTLNGTPITGVDPAGLAAGIYTLDYAVFITNDCQANLSGTLEILPTPVASFTFPADTICLDELITLTVNTPVTSNTIFHWDFGDAILADPLNEENPEISWNTTGNQTVSLWIEEAGCPSDTVEQTVFVLGLPEAPQLSCIDATTTSVAMSWSVVSLATSYAITVLTGQTGTQTGNAIQFDNLLPEEEVQIIVTAIGVCGTTASNSISCSSLACDPIEITMPTIDPICLDNSVPTIQLNAGIPAGIILDDSSWTGLGIIDPNGVFDPAIVGVGIHRVYYNFLAQGCAGIDSLDIEVLPIPIASFENPDAICLEETGIINFTGTATSSAIFNWAFDGGSILSGSGSGPYEIQWDNPGTYTISLFVEDGPCNSNIFSQTIEVDPTIELPTINCDASLTSLTFSWDLPLNVSDVSIDILSGQIPTTISNTNVVFDNLDPEEEVEIGITFISDNACPDQELIHTCQTLPCPTIDLSISAIDPICLTSDTAPFQLEVAILGDPNNVGSGTWNGPGITGSTMGVFAPQLAGTGVHTIQYSYQIATCIYNAEIEVIVNPTPSSDFEVSPIICVLDEAVATYTGNASSSATFNWDFGPGATPLGGGSGPYTISWENPGIKTITLVVEDQGCISEVFTQQLEVQPALEEPMVLCSPNLNSVTLSWDPIDNASAYMISWLGNSVTVTDLFFTIPGLETDQVITVEISAISNNACPSSSVVFGCTTLPCPEIDLDISPINPICFDGLNDTIEVNFSATNVPDINDINWEGPNIISTNPPTIVVDSDWINRENRLIVSYQLSTCFYADTIFIEVSPEPIASFDAPDVICLTDTATIEFTGLTGANPNVNWNFDGGFAEPGAGLDLQQVIWSTVGTKTITLDINENGCTAETATHQIEVEQPLGTPTINCVARFDSLLFTWDAVAFADSYEVQVAPTFPGTRLSETSYLLTNLPDDTAIDFQLTVASSNSCADVVVEQSCSTLACPTVNVNLEASNAICLGESVTVSLRLDNPNTGPFDIVLSDGMNTYELNGVEEEAILELQPSSSTTISITSIINQSAQACNIAIPTPITIQVNQPVSAGTALAPLSFCTNENAIISLPDRLINETAGGTWIETSTSPSSGFNSITGQFNSSNQSSGVYTFQYQVEGQAPCPNEVSEVQISLLQAPVANAGPDQTLTCDDPTTEVGLNADTTDPAIMLSWNSLEGHFLEDPTLANLPVEMPGSYILEVRNTTNQCFDLDTVLVNSDISFITPFVSVSSISCFQARDGFISIDSIQGGSAPLSLSLNGEDVNNRTLFSGLEPGLYDLLIADSKGCETLLTLEVQDKDETTVQLVTNIPNQENLIELGEDVILSAITNIPVSEIDTLLWSPDTLQQKNSFEQLVQPFQTATFSVMVRDTAGCTASDQLTLFVSREQNVFIPNVFSPNGDGQNDIFFIFGGQEVQEIKSFAVFNRWGEAIVELKNFQPNDPRFGWDGTYRGKPMNAGVFVFFAEVEMIDGEVILFKGDVSLVR